MSDIAANPDILSRERFLAEVNQSIANLACTTFLDLHDAALRADRDKWREKSLMVQQRYDNLSESVKATEAALDACRAETQKSDELVIFNATEQIRQRREYAAIRATDNETILRLTEENESLKRDAHTVSHLRQVLTRVRERPHLGDNLTDSEMAGKIRMMMRDDLDHELVCVMARDRIISLSDQISTARAALKVAVAERDEIASFAQNYEHATKLEREDHEAEIAKLRDQLSEHPDTKLRDAAGLAFATFSQRVMSDLMPSELHAIHLLKEALAMAQTQETENGKMG